MTARNAGQNPEGRGDAERAAGTELPTQALGVAGGQGLREPVRFLPSSLAWLATMSSWADATVVNVEVDKTLQSHWCISSPTIYVSRLPLSCVPCRKWQSLLSGAWRTRQRTGWTCTPARRTFSCQGSHLETFPNAANADAWRTRRRIGWTCTPARRTPTWRSSGPPPPRRRALPPPRPRPLLGSRLPLQRRRPPPARAPLRSEHKGRENDRCCKGRGSRQGAGRRGSSGCDRGSEHRGRLNDDME